jgi:FlaA1/EpsC-like NDP-sugar epimerase
MESKAGSILLLISGILTIIAGLVAFVFFLIAAPSGGGNALSWILILFLVVAIVIGALKIWTASLMKNPETTKKGGIIALILGILTGGDLLAIIGGILGIVQGSK